MASTDPTSLPVAEQEVSACRHLRSTGMYLYTDRPVGEAQSDYDNTAFWCLKTLKSFGPDDDVVGRTECRDPARSCYEPI